MALKKQWYEIYSPKAFGEKMLGETPATDPKGLIGRRIVVSLLELSRDYSKFYIKLLFQIGDVQGNKAYTKLVGHDITRERIYRMVQRRVRRVDVIQDVVTKDGVKARIKTVFVLIRRIGTSIKSATRKMAKEIIEAQAKEKTFEELIRSIIAGELQQLVRKECFKISPLGNIEIRKSEILPEKKKEEVEKQVIEVAPAEVPAE